MNYFSLVVVKAEDPVETSPEATTTPAVETTTPAVETGATTTPAAETGSAETAGTVTEAPTGTKPDAVGTYFTFTTISF